MRLIGIDFSVIKPAITIKENDIYKFYVFPLSLSKKHESMLLDSDVIVCNREDNTIKKSENSTTSTENMKYHITMARNLSQLISNTIQFTESDIIASEGFSYASSGDAVLNLAGYKYILLNTLLNNHIKLENIYTFAPISIKSFAGCGKKGTKKIDMINSFIENGVDCKFKENCKNNYLKSKINFIHCVDDIVDSYFTVKLLEKTLNV